MSVSANWPAIGFTIFPNLGGIIGGYVTKPTIEKWYQHLKKPEWRPPNWAFGPVWTGLYSSIGYASYLVYRDAGGFGGAAQLPFIVFGTNLATNWAWSPIFFGAKETKLALFDLVAIDVTAITMTYLFYNVNKTAGLLILPYCAWLGLATALNYCIWRDNKDGAPTAQITELKDQ